MVRPLHGAAGADPGAAQRHRPGDRVAPRDARQCPAQLPRADRLRPGDAAGAGVIAPGYRRRSRSRWRCSAAQRSCSAASGRSSSAAPARGARWRANPRRSRCWRSSDATAAATAATSCTSASPCCSSGWPPPRPSSTPPQLGLRPGQSTRVGAYEVRYVADGHDHAQVRRGSYGLDAQPGRGTGRHQRTATTCHAEPQRGLLRLRGSQPGDGRQPDRRSGRSATWRMTAGPHARRMDGDRTGHRSAEPEADRQGRQQHAASRTRRSSRSPTWRAPTSSTRRLRSSTSSSRRW